MNGLNEFNNTNFDIQSEADVVKINLILRRTIEFEKMICDRIDPEIANAYKTHKGLTAMKKEELQPILNVKERCNASLKDWQRKKEAEAKALQDKINADLKAQVEAEKARLLSEAKDDFSKEIAKEKIEEMKAVQVDLKECQTAVIQKQEGQYKRSNWKAKIVNPDLVPKEFWKIDESMLDKVAKMTKGNQEIPGVEFWDDFTIVTKV
jgi:hypothetical protein